MKGNQQIVFGLRAVLEALEAGRELEKVLLKRTSESDIFRQLLTELKKREIPIQWVPVEKLNRVTGKNHQGVIAYISEIQYSDITMLLPALFESGQDPLILILDQVTDVRNFGAIARSAECAGVHAIIIPSMGSARITADAIKASAGALHRIPVCRHDSLVVLTKFLRESGLKLFAATEKASDSLYNTDMTGPAGIILGSEEKGISNALLKDADQWIAIPLRGQIASLNVSVASGVILFEVQRQREVSA